MSRVVRRKKKLQKNKLKTAFTVFVIVVCLLVIYKFNFTTKSEVEITTLVKFKEYESENELLSNIELLEDEKGKYIILPDKVNGIFVSAYYLSEKDIQIDVEENENVVTNSTVSNIDENIVVKNETTIEDNTLNTTDEEENSVSENKTDDKIVVNGEKNEFLSSLASEQDTLKEKTIEEQIDEINETESLFDKVTQDTEDYADLLEKIAENSSENSENSKEGNSSINSENNESENTVVQEIVSENAEQILEESETSDEEIAVNDVENKTKVVPETGNEIITEKTITQPGEKYYLSEDEIENENIELTVSFQTIQINGVKLYNQELTADMINAIIKLTCYTPLGYYLDVTEEDINNIQELKSDVEELSKSDTVLAYDIKITNGEEEYQPEDYYQVATVSITKPETVDFKANSSSLQLLHIKESEEEIVFEKMEMSNIENDGFEFLTNEFSVYAVILYAADQGDSITINDYDSDYNYYIGKNYTDDISGEYSGAYTSSNLSKVTINYYSYDYEKAKSSISLSGNITTNSYNYNSGIYYYNTTISVSGSSYIDKNSAWTMTFALPATATLDIDETISKNSSLGISVSYSGNTVTISGNNWLTGWTKNSDEAYSLSGFNEDTINLVIAVTASTTLENTLLNSTTVNLTTVEREKIGYVSATERQTLFTYVKCVPIDSNGNINIELIDNPYMDRPVGYGFDGWTTHESHTISLNTNTYVQTLTTTGTAELTINLYANWSQANVVFVNASSGTNTTTAPYGTSMDYPVLTWANANTVLTKSKKTATNASNRELNIIVLMGGSLDNLSSSSSIATAYTITSLYNGIDYRNNATLNMKTNTVANADFQIDFVKLIGYISNTSSVSYYRNDGSSDLNYYLCGNTYNIRIGRGMITDNNNQATICQVQGGYYNTTKSEYRLVVESGKYTNIQLGRAENNTAFSSNSTLVLGNDFDRIQEDNDNLSVYYRVSSRTGNYASNVSNSSLPLYTMIVKSGTFGMDNFSVRGDSYQYAGVYVGGHGSSNSSTDNGDRYLIVEGGNIANIIGGLKTSSGTSVETKIYVKGGTIANIVGGAGVTQTYGDRIVQVTGGTITYSVSGASNGVLASVSNTSGNNGRLVGDILIYIGGNAVVGAESDYDTLYDVEKGCVLGAGNGNAGCTYSGNATTSHVIIDGNATITNNVYGGGNYGYLESATGGSSDMDDYSSALVDGESYIMADGNTSTSNAMYYYSTNQIRYTTMADSEEFYWTIERSGTNEIYIKYGNEYLIAPTTNNSTNISYTQDKNSATLFTYSNGLLYFTSGRTTYYLNFNNYQIRVSRNSQTQIYFLKFKEKTDDEDIVATSCIDIYGGTINNDVYGGSNENKIVGNVKINMYNGKIEGTMYGGSNDSGNIEGNVYIYINGGNIGTQSSQDSVFGGGQGSSTNINNNVKINIKDTANNTNILGNIYGGSAYGNIKGATNINVEDHYSSDYAISISGNIFGGGKGSSSVSPTSTGNVTVNVDGGTYSNLNVYGGYNASGTVPNYAIAVNIGENYATTINDVYGGGNEANVANTTTSVIVKMYKNATVNNAYNGGNSAGITGTNTREIYAIGATINNLFGGSNNSGDLEFTNVYVSDDAKIGNVFGGGNKAAITKNTNVDITNSQVEYCVYGGGNQASVGSYTDVDIENSTITKVYGGGNAGEVTDSITPSYGNSTNVDIIGGSNITTVYGGGCSASIALNSAVYIENSTITNVFGGGEGENATVGGNTDVLTNGLDDGTVTILENIYGGGDLGKVTGNALVTSSLTNVSGSVFGGGNNADVEGNTTVNISESTAQNVYGGGMNGAVGKSAAVAILDQTIISNNLFGGGSKGNVAGNTVVSINNSKVINNAFGGGEAASVYGTTVSLTSGSQAKNVYGGGDNGVTITNTSVALKSVTIEESAFGAGNGSPAIVKGKSYIYADGITTIGESLFAGGNNSSTGTTDTNPNADLANKAIEKATAVADIAGATIGENVYGGANTSVIYGDTVINIGNEAIKDYYSSISAYEPSYTQGKISIGGTIYGGGEQMDPSKEYNYDTVSVEGYIQINIDGTGYDTGADDTINISGSIFGSGHASRAGLPTSYLSSADVSDNSETTAGYVTINGDVNIKNYGTVNSPKSMVSIQRCTNVIINESSLWISGATDSTNTHSSTYFSFNHIDALKLKNSSTLYLRATSNLLKSYYSLVDIDGVEEKATVEIVNEITGSDGNTYDAIGNYIYDSSGNIEYVIKSGQIFTSDSSGNAIELVTDVEKTSTKSVNKNADNRIYMYSGLNLNISTDENLGDDTWGPVEGMTFFGIFNTTNTTIDQDEDVDISQTTDTNTDTTTINTGMYNVNYQVSSTTALEWDERNFNRSYVEGKHVRSPEEQDIQVDGFYTNYEKFGVEYGDDEEIEEETYAEHNPTSYTDYITPTPDETNYYIWYAGPDQDFYYYDLVLIASKLSTYGTVEKTLQGISVANATFKITSVESSLINGAVLYEKNNISSINTTGDPNKEFALAMKTGGNGWSMNGETDFVTSPTVAYTGTDTYKTENSSTTPTLGFYLYHSNNISEEAELGYFTINMTLYYWKTSTQQAKARVTIDVAIATKVYDDLGYDASITPGRQYELFTRTTTNITTKSSFSAYFQLYEKDFANNENLTKFFSHTEYEDEEDIEGTDVVDTELINEFINTNYRLIKTDYVFPEDTTITMIDRSTDNPTYYYYTVTADDNSSNKKTFRLSEFRKMGSTSEDEETDTAEYYLDSNRSTYITTVDGVTYQSECFIFIVDFESALFENIDDLYEIVKNQAFHLVLTSDVKNAEGEALEISVLEEYKETNSISFGIYNTDSTIKLDATISPNKIYLGDSSDISVETNYIVEKKDTSDVTTVYDTRYFDSKLGVKITIYDEAGDVVQGANLLGAYFKVTEADGTTGLYYPRTDGTTRMKIADKVSNSKATITFETSKSTLPTGTYTFLIESFGSADGVYFGVESSDSTEVTLSIINDEFGLESEIPSTYVIIDKDTGYTIEDTTGFNIEKEYEILDSDGNVVGETTEELNDGKNDFEFSVKYSSGYENPYIAVSLYRRNYDEVYDRTYTLVDLADYIDAELISVPDDIKDQFVTADDKYVGYEAYSIDFINEAVADALGSSSDATERPTIKLTTKCSLKDTLVSGTYKLLFTLYDRNEVERNIEIENADGTITVEKQTVIEYQYIGETFSYMIIK